MRVAIITKPGYTYNCFSLKAQDFGADNFKYQALPRKGDSVWIMATQRQGIKEDAVKGYVPYKQHQAWYWVRRKFDSRDFIIGPDGFEVIGDELEDELFEI